MSDSRKEAERRLKAAKDHRDEMCSAFERGSYFVAGREAQLCIENSGKAFVSCFEIPEWVHTVKDQIEGIVKKYEVAENWKSRLLKVGDYSEEAFPAHIEANYGVERGDTYLSPSEAFDGSRARDLMSKAEYSYRNARAFVDEYFEESPQENT